MRLILILIQVFMIMNLEGAFQEFLLDANGDSVVGSFRIYNFDSRGIFWNPASLENVENRSVFFNYSPGYFKLEGVDIVFNSFSFNGKVFNQRYGIGYTSLEVGSQYRETKFILSFSKNIFGFKSGINLNSLKNKFILDERTKVDPVFKDRHSKGSFSIDLGVIKNFRRFSVSCVIKNVNSPNIGIREKEEIPVEAIFTFGKKFYLNRYKLFTEIGVYKRKDVIRFKVGTSFSIKFLGLRFGVDNEKVGFGIGLKGFKSLIFNYCAVYPFDLSKIVYELSLGVEF